MRKFWLFPEKWQNRPPHIHRWKRCLCRVVLLTPAQSTPCFPRRAPLQSPHLSLASLEEGCLLPRHCLRPRCWPSSGRSHQPIARPSHTPAATACSPLGPSPFEMPGPGLSHWRKPSIPIPDLSASPDYPTCLPVPDP